MKTSMPRMGTITMYREVINPPLPTLVYVMPICWKREAMVKAKPQMMPPRSSLLRVAGSSVPHRVKGLPASLSKNKKQGHKKSVAKKLREKLKVRGSTYSAPTLWAMKAVPQMREQSISMMMPLKLYISILQKAKELTEGIVPYFGGGVNMGRMFSENKGDTVRTKGLLIFKELYF